MTDPERIQLIGLAALGLAWLLALGMLIGLIAYRRRHRSRARPSFARMLAEPAYFRQSMIRLLVNQGYRVMWFEVRKDRIERQPREVAFGLMRGHDRYFALAGRWVIPITSEMVTRFEAERVQRAAPAGLIIVTSIFSAAALDQARSLPVQLVDRDGVHEWIVELAP